MSTRRSFIARLPKEVRQQVNTMLEDGATYQSIIDWLVSKGFPQFTPDCIMNWKNGGFQDWLRAQHDIESAKALREWATSVSEENGSAGLPSAYICFAAAQLKKLVDDIDAGRAQVYLAEHPDHYAKIFNSLARFTKLALELEKIAATLRASEQQLQANPPKRITEASVEQIEDRLKLM
jgi:hypothetical protein